MNKLNDLIDEIYAIKRDVLRYHVRAQKSQGGQYPDDYYTYDKKNKKYSRVYVRKRK